MLISHSHRFIFVHVWKTGGTSVRTALSLLTERGSTKIPKHATAREVRALVGEEVFKSHFKFAFVRNPWEIQVSNFFYLRERSDHPMHGMVSRFSTFSEYVMWVTSEQRISQCSLLAADDGNCLVDFIGRFERLREDFAAVCERIGLPRGLDIPHENSSSHLHYSHYYDEPCRSAVAKAYGDDVEAFGYYFEQI